jgi:hypothetical protein
VSDLRAKLAELLIEHGASPSLAAAHADDVFERILPHIQREQRNRAIRDLFPKIGAAGVAERLNIDRSTAYRALKRRSHESPALATNAA